MQQLTVPEAVWACQQPGVPLVAAIVEGVDPLNPALGWRSLDAAPPAWSVALRDARCERCKGKGRLRQWQNEAGPGGGWATIPCDDGCVDGRLLHDVRVECGVCQGTGDDPPTHVEADYHGPCLACETTDKRHPGYRTVRCLVDFVEVRAFPMLIGSHVVISGDEVWFWPNTDVRPLAVDTPSGLQFTDPDVLTPAHVDALAAACGKPPADWVGGYAVIVTGVGE